MPEIGRVVLDIFLKILTTGELADRQDFIDHFLLAFLIVGCHGIFETSVEVALEQHLMGGLEQADDGQVLLHDVNAISPVIQHADDFVDVAGSFFEVDKGGLVARIHKGEKLMTQPGTYTCGGGMAVV